MIKLVFNNGMLQSGLSDLPKGIALQEDKDFFQLTIEKNTALLEPVFFENTYLPQANIIKNKLIKLAENAHVTLVEIFNGQENYSHTSNVHVQLAAHAELHYFRIQNDSLQAKHTTQWKIEHAQESKFNFFSAAIGAMQCEQQIDAFLKEPHAECNFNGIYWLNNQKQEEVYNITTHHESSHTKSRIYFKGILNHNAKVRFKGKAHVLPNVQNVQAAQGNHTLLLSKQAEVISKPELEIYAHDVKCTHGATVGELDPDKLFYLRSRGVEKKEAEYILAKGFIAELIDGVKNPTIQQILSNYLECELANVS